VLVVVEAQLGCCCSAQNASLPFLLLMLLLQASLPTSDIKYATESSKTSKSGSKVIFGEFDKQQPWAVQELKLHFHHDKPFKRVSGLEQSGAACLQWAQQVVPSHHSGRSRWCLHISHPISCTLN
jgi:hypothetical protein